MRKYGVHFICLEAKTLAEKRFSFNVFSISKGLQRFDDARGEYLNVCPLRISSIEECEKYRQSKTTSPDLFYMQKDYATKISPQVRIKKRKKLNESRNTLRNNS